MTTAFGQTESQVASSSHKFSNCGEWDFVLYALVLCVLMCTSDDLRSVKLNSSLCVS